MLDQYCGRHSERYYRCHCERYYRCHSERSEESAISRAGEVQIPRSARNDWGFPRSDTALPPVLECARRAAAGARRVPYLHRAADTLTRSMREAQRAHEGTSPGTLLPAPPGHAHTTGGERSPVGNKTTAIIWCAPDRRHRAEGHGVLRVEAELWRARHTPSPPRLADLRRTAPFCFPCSAARCRLMS